MGKKFFYIFVIISVLLSSCAVKKYKDIPYLENPNSSKEQPTLNIFSPKDPDNKKSSVLLFVHGGNWNSGSKNWYNFFGRNFARKGITCVIIDYTLSPNASYEEMTQEVADAIKWTKRNIENYNKKAETLFVTGHSAGAHLVSLAIVNPKYGIAPNTVAGIILNDAGALDMYKYLQKNPPTSNENYLDTWSADPKNWKQASPIYFLNEDTPPIMMYVGKKTYPAIKQGNMDFLWELQKYQPEASIQRVNKKHIPMITQYLWPWNKRYDEIIEFMDSNTE
ncbi:alpha/beta hydrolase [Gillisia sp. M10.2A]|uniref:Alpha/beta hydrolase n=1 Tax=Gillisia lutea TaxID=2909668 RepID=A0ABS9EE18_9FLAO|nr:alpha/beta hydrolase [Gillisia lutea]MCF4101110.1 alpha/beta hydrolase [Gillisia lutea]